MKIEVSENSNAGWKMATLFPFEGRPTLISAWAEPANDLLKRRADYTVNWPAIGAASTATTREFAQALLAAANWVDEQKAKQELAMSSAKVKMAIARERDD